MAIKSYSLFFLAVVSPFLGLACSDEPPDPLDSADGFCTEWGKNACAANVVTDCQTTDARCELAQKDSCLEKVSDAKYTRTGAEECLEFIRDAYRDQALELDELNAFSSLGEPCDMLLAGTGDVGDQCTKTEDCDTTVDLKCVIKFGETRGECQEPKEVNGGGRCSEPEAVCIDGYYCNGSHCLEAVPQNDPCSAEEPCGEGLRCIFEADAEVGICEPKLDIGDDCETNDECASSICDRNESEVEDNIPGICVQFLELGRRVDMCDEFRN